MGTVPKKSEAHVVVPQGDGSEDEKEEGANVAKGTKEAFDAAHHMWKIPADAADASRPARNEISKEDLEKASLQLLYLRRRSIAT